MAGHALIYTVIFCLIYGLSSTTAQQPYASENCPKSDNTSSVLGYSCNGVNKTCQSYLIFRTVPPYNNVSSIASLMSVSASQISAINQNIPENFTMATNTEVIIPVECSCAGQFYQANTTYVVQTDDNYFIIANDKFGGLTTCKAISSQKRNPNIVNIFPNERLIVPLRCACPTRGQFNDGIKYLMSFVIEQGDTIWSIADKFGADLGKTLEANEKSEQDSEIYSFTTLLVPLDSPPDSSVMEYPALIISPSPESSPPLLSASPPPAPPPPYSTGGNEKWTYFGVGLASGGALVLVAGVILFCLFSRCVRKRTEVVASSERFESEENALVKKPETESFEFLKDISGIASLKVYSFQDLQVATNGFSSSHLIKGSVYKGVLEGNQVAIKTVNGDVSKEISVLNKINHFNLVNLLGVGFNEGVWYLIYENVVNGPLSDWIYADNPEKSLSWGKRMQVALDVATGLNYLHSYTSPPLIHKDIKTDNILLDSQFRAKIANFALSKAVSGTDSQFTVTKHIVGTTGYLAPEYLDSGLVSPMLDVYSFGVILVEILTGKTVAVLYEGGKANLYEVLAPLLIEGEGNVKLKEFVDESLGDDYPTDVAMSMAVLADRCLRKDPGSRPTMDDIVRILSKTLTGSLNWVSSSTSTTSSGL
ncbi:hypothetical protein vseg_015836 [Gypsophila vaccaria]